MVCTTTSIWHAAQPVPHSCRAYCRTAANVVRDRLRQPSACSARSLACHALAGLEAAGRCRCSSITFLLTVRSCCLLPCAWRDEHAFRENGTTVSPRPLSSTLAGSTSGVCTAPVPAIPNLKASSDLESSNPAPSSAQGMTPRAAHLSPVLTQASWVKRPRKRRRWLWSNKKQGSLLTGRCFSRFEENSRISVFFHVSRIFFSPGKTPKIIVPYGGKVPHRCRTSGRRTVGIVCVVSPLGTVQDISGSSPGSLPGRGWSQKAPCTTRAPFVQSAETTHRHSRDQD